MRLFFYGIEPTIWRQIEVPDTLTFRDLHSCIAQAFDFPIQEPHAFRYGKGRHLDQVIALGKEDVGSRDTLHDEETMILGKFVGRKSLPMRLLYRYHFEADWTLEMVIEESVFYEKPSLVLCGGQRAAPPLDCMGVSEYRQCLEGSLEWLDDAYSPELFDSLGLQFSL